MRLRKGQMDIINKYVRRIKYIQDTPRTTFCVLIMNDGWEVFGSSSCNSDENYDKQHGRDLALLHALARLKAKLANNV